MPVDYRTLSDLLVLSSASLPEEPAGAQRHQPCNSQEEGGGTGRAESPVTPVAEERQWGVPPPVVVVVGTLGESISSRGRGDPAVFVLHDHQGGRIRRVRLW